MPDAAVMAMSIARSDAVDQLERLNRELRALQQRQASSIFRPVERVRHRATVRRDVGNRRALENVSRDKRRSSAPFPSACTRVRNALSPHASSAG